MTQESTESAAPASPVLPPIRPRRSPIRRAGCAILLVIWFAILLTPCFFIVLATRGEITVSLGDIPGQSLRIWLINEARERGLAVSRPSVTLIQDNTAACMRTDVTFLLWQGQEKPTHFCECFTRPKGTTEWLAGQANLEQCTP